jgi:hypothetical protein
VAKTLASGIDLGKDHYYYYNKHNQPFSTDWAIMLKWILDKMSFTGIPAHYLIMDPTLYFNIRKPLPLPIYFLSLKRKGP